jgi:hypothetical protein
MKLIGRDMGRGPNREAMWHQPETEVLHVQDGDFKIVIEWDYTVNSRGRHSCACLVLDGNYNIVYHEIAHTWTCSIRAFKWYFTRAEQEIELYDPS